MIDNSNSSIVFNRNYSITMANEIIRGKQEMNLLQAKIIRLMITQIVQEDQDFKTYTCRITDLARFLKITSDNVYRDIYVICNQLLDSKVQIGTRNPRQPWEMFHWISRASYDGKGNLTLCLSEQIKPYILELNDMFTSYQMGEILLLSSFYAIRFYELLISFDRLIIGSRKEKRQFSFTIEYLRTFFNCEKKYPKNNDFIRRVLESAIAEINQKTNILITARYIKTGRKITDVEIDITTNIPVMLDRIEE